ncbi:MAG TPA: sigma-54 dependent transcriptional regulator [Gemmatimonadales bacterium]|nr:sigma-54 dependent transcriptional regulator [Gemmatimonadales bacterium]
MQLSDSFRSTLADLAQELGAELVRWSPADGEAPPGGSTCVLLLAGGAESQAVDQLNAISTDLPKYVVGAARDHRLAAAALQRGARDYFALPDDLGLLRRSLERERRESAGKAEAAKFAEDERRLAGFDAIVGTSPALRRMIEQGIRVAQHRDVTVLIGGETGTGKELLARALHYHSPRAAAPFVEINCAAIPSNLLESELFGHEKGAFTGAIAAKQGLMELAHGGTVFLDEIGNLPIDLQPKLLRALEGREIRRVGGQQTRKVDIRVIGATHVDLKAAVARGEFREDLYYRLNVVNLVLPPLRERGEDIELLARTFVARLAKQYNLEVPVLTPQVISALQMRSWPGNVRELRNAIERSLVLSPPGTLELAELPAETAPATGPGGVLPFPASIRTITRAAVQEMLKLVNNNKSEAARRLEISRPRLQRILDGTGDDDQGD